MSIVRELLLKYLYHAMVLSMGERASPIGTVK